MLISDCPSAVVRWHDLYYYWQSSAALVRRALRTRAAANTTVALQGSGLLKNCLCCCRQFCVNDGQFSVVDNVLPIIQRGIGAHHFSGPPRLWGGCGPSLT